MNDLIGLSIQGSINSKFKIYPYISDNKIAYSCKINDSNHILTFHDNKMIGIGTSEPSEKLNIYNGALKIDNSNTAIIINDNSLKFYSNSILNGIINTENNYIAFNSNYFFKDELFIKEFRPFINNWHRSIDDKQRFYFSSNSSTIFGSPNGYEWYNKNNSNIISINNNGYLGIGITVPLNNLHITSDNQYPFKISSKTIHNNGTFISLNTEACNWTKCSIGHIRTSNFDIGDIIFMTNNNNNSTSATLNDERMRIKSNGFIGIGITNPAVNLHLNNNEVKLKLTDYSSSNGLLLIKGRNASIINEDNSDLIFGSYSKELFRITSNNKFNFTSIKPQIDVNNNPFMTYENLNISIGSTATKTIFNSYIGIGANPIELLHTQGTIASINADTKNHIRILNDNSSGLIDIGSSINGLGIRINNSGEPYGNNNYIERFRIKSDGNIGIGNQNPISSGTDTNLTIGDSSLNTSKGFLIISKGTNDFKRHFKLGYGFNNFMCLGDYGTNNSAGTWKEQLRIHWDAPVNSMVVYQNGDLNVYGKLFYASDIKIKKDIKTIENALEKVEKLNGIEYTNIRNNSNEIGLIAQEVEKVIPQVVNYDKENELKMVAYANLIPLLINAIKELNKKISKS